MNDGTCQNLNMDFVFLIRAHRIRSDQTLEMTADSAVPILCSC